MIVAETDLEKIPECCEECPFFVLEASDYGRCPITDLSKDCEEMAERYDCPLKEVPDNG